MFDNEKWWANVRVKVKADPKKTGYSLMLCGVAKNKWAFRQGFLIFKSCDIGNAPTRMSLKLQAVQFRFTVNVSAKCSQNFSFLDQLGWESYFETLASKVTNYYKVIVRRPKSVY